MPPQKDWTEKDIDFITTVQTYHLQNVLGIKRSKRIQAWHEISVKLNVPENYCRRKWNTIKYNYVLLKKSIDNGIVTEHEVRNSTKTAKYLDGTLDFLNRYVSIIPNSEIPAAAHRFFDSAFESRSRYIEKLIKTKDNNATVIKDYKQATEIEPMSILPTIENYDSDSGNTQEAIVVSFGTDREVSEESPIHADNDINDIAIVNTDILPKTHDNNAIVIKDYKQETEIEPMSILPTIENYDSDSGNTQEAIVVSFGTDHEVSEESPIHADNDINDIAIVNTDILPKTHDNNAIVIKDYKQETEIEPMSILPTIENYDSDSGNTQEAIVVSFGTDQEVSEESPIHADNGINDIAIVNTDILPKTYDTNFTSSGRLRKILMSAKKKQTRPRSKDCCLANFLVKYKSNSIEMNEVCNLKKYMSDLAEVVCTRLAPQKRKNFLREVDLIVSDVLEGTT